MKGYTLAALVVSGLGLIGLIAVVALHGNVREHIADNYRALPDERLDARAEPTKVYASPLSVTATTKNIADAHEPADRRVTPEGAFLRYSDDIVSVLPAAGGARILVDDDETGYRRNYYFVGGWWGTYSGPAESFRGGGPGGGK